MANSYSGDTTTSNRQASSRNSLNSNSTHVISQRQLSDSRTPTTCFLLFENASSINSTINFLPYCGTRARNHHTHKLFLPKIVSTHQLSSDYTYNEFANSIKQVLNTIPYQDLLSYVISVRTGVAYFFSKCFRFKKTYSISQLHDITHRKISTTNTQYYYPSTNNSKQLDESLRSSFCNGRPISETQKFAGELQSYQFEIKEQKHVFRVYLQSEDGQTHVCTVDPSAKYSIVEFSKDFQRTSNIDVIRDRHQSNFRESQTYDDIFDFRVQFQYNPRTRSDQRNTIEYELHQEFPLLDSDIFKNEYILQPTNDDFNDDGEFHISEQLLPYIRFIRRDFGDVYHYNGDDEYFKNYTIYLESSVEYRIDRQKSTCKHELATHGIVYARLDLNTMISSGSVNEEFLIRKLWDMGTGLTSIAGQCTTSKAQESTIYYTSNGEKYTASDEALVQTILKQPTLHLMLDLPNNTTDDDIRQSCDRIIERLDGKWRYIRSGPMAWEKLNEFYYQYFVNSN